MKVLKNKLIVVFLAMVLVLSLGLGGLVYRMCVKHLRYKYED